MGNDSKTSAATETKISQTRHRLEHELADLLAVAPEAIPSSQPFDVLLPRSQRRRLWQELQQAGFELPGLGLSRAMALALVLMVLSPLVALALLLRNGLVFLTLAETTLLARRLTRPWAIHPPLGYESTREVAIALTPFTREDYRTGLWPREEIAAKVRWIVATATAMPFAAVTDETRLFDITDC